MTNGFLNPLKNTLFEALDICALDRDVDGIAVREGITLRSPKNDAWGDLCTNVLLLLCGDDKDARERFAPVFIERFEALPAIRSATLSGSGYINLHIEPKYWGHQLVTLAGEGLRFGLSEISPIADYKIAQPDTSEDLVSARQMWNATALTKLAEIVSWKAVSEPWISGEIRGLPTKSAAAKCTENILRLSLLSNGVEFAIHFSPMLAVDKSYLNPAFCIPYAHARLTALLELAEEKSAGEQGKAPGDIILTERVDEIYFNLPLEQNIAKKLCEWPIAVEQCLKNRDMIHLTAFLQDLSLLFFRLSEQERLQSSDYLIAGGQKTGRKLLLQAVDTFICGGLEILGFDIVEEFV